MFSCFVLLFIPSFMVRAPVKGEFCGFLGGDAPWSRRSHLFSRVCPRRMAIQLTTAARQGKRWATRSSTITCGSRPSGTRGRIANGAESHGLTML